MLLGQNSIGHHIVLVEFEDVNVDFRLQTSNMETEAVRKGMAQINDWKRWMVIDHIFCKAVGCLMLEEIFRLGGLPIAW